MEVLAVYVMLILVVIPVIMTIGWAIAHVIRALYRGIHDGMQN